MTRIALALLFLTVALASAAESRPPTLQVEKISDLRGLRPGGEKSALVLGYLQPGDGGGGIFYRLNAGKTIRDDGGITIIGQDGTVWRRLEISPVNPRWFGAVGTGRSRKVKDVFSSLERAQQIFPEVKRLDQEMDGVAHQSAFEYCARRGGGMVTTPAGIYLIDEPLVPKGNLVWSGEGQQNTLLRQTSRGRLVNRVGDHKDDLAIRDLTFEGGIAKAVKQDQGTKDDGLVRIAQYASLQIERVTLRFSRRFSLAVPDGGSFWLSQSVIEYGLRDGVNATGARSVTISDNRFSHLGDDAIACHVPVSAKQAVWERVVIRNNSIERSLGIKLLGIQNALVEGNRLNLVYGYGIRVGQDATYGEGFASIRDVQIINNQITNLVDSADLGYGEGRNAIWVEGLLQNGKAPVEKPVSQIPPEDFDQAAGRDAPLAGANRILISGNIVAQTLPDGKDHELWNNGGVRLVSALKLRRLPVGVFVSGDVGSLQVEGNSFYGLKSGVDFKKVNWLGPVIVESNQFVRSAFGLRVFGSKPIGGALLISGNFFNLDPYKELGSSDEERSGTAISIPKNESASREGNVFRNCESF